MGWLSLLTSSMSAWAQADPELVRSGAGAGISQYSPGTWGIVGYTVRNPGPRPRELYAVSYFNDQPNLQFSRLVWVPAQARLSTWAPVLLPADTPADARAADISSLLEDRAGARPVVFRNSLGQVTDPGLLRVETNRPVTGVISDGNDDDSIDAVVAARISARLIKRMAYLRSNALPPIVEAWQGLDQLVICEDDPRVATAELQALRRWVNGGGRLWVMLDQVSPAFLAALLGDTCRLSVVDDVGLTEVEIVSPRGAAPSRSFEKPVRFVRVLAPDMTATHHVNGWPAALSKRIGRGSLLITTLGPRAWTRPRDPQDKKPDDPLMIANVLATGPLEELADRFFAPTPPEPLQPAALDPYVKSQIGYRIVSRGPVVLVLGSFCVALLLAGLWLMRGGTLERMGWIAPGAAVLAALALLMMGAAAREAVPASVADAQFIPVTADSAELSVSGLMAIYTPDESRQTLGADRGGLFMPDLTALGGTNPRMVWTDVDRWHWEQLSLPPGATRVARFTHTRTLATPIRVIGRFGPRGLTGRLIAPELGAPSDALIATRDRRALTVRFASDGSFTVAADDLLPMGQYLVSDAAVFSDEQIRRRGVYESLLRQSVSDEFGPIDAAGDFPDEPTLLFWCDPVDTGFVFAEGVRRVGSALVATPLTLQRCEPDTDVVIPASLTEISASRVSIYNERQGRWIGPLSTGIQMPLRFTLPEQTLPIQLRKLVLTVLIRAPMRTVQVLPADGSRTILAQRDHPDGVVRFEIDDPRALGVDDEGAVNLELRVTEPPASFAGELPPQWTIEYVGLEARGRTPPR